MAYEVLYKGEVIKTISDGETVILNTKDEYCESDILVREKTIIPYLTFSSESSFTLKTYNIAKNWDGTLEYSTDLSTWTTWNGESISSVYNMLYLRGTNNSYITGNGSRDFVLSGTDITCSGNIENLLDYETVLSGNHPVMAEKCYYGLFGRSPNLISAPSLPATTLSNYCYSNMFAGTSITIAPKLPATTLTYYCYSAMFYNCNQLNTLPKLPATILAPGSYQDMFDCDGCNNVYMSKTQSEFYAYEWRVPTTGTVPSQYQYDYLNMISGIHRNGIGNIPDYSTTYYVNNPPV